jgi:hypothetical protein
MVAEHNLLALAQNLTTVGYRFESERPIVLCDEVGGDNIDLLRAKFGQLPALVLKQALRIWGIRWKKC